MRKNSFFYFIIVSALIMACGQESPGKPVTSKTTKNTEEEITPDPADTTEHELKQTQQIKAPARRKVSSKTAEIESLSNSLAGTSRVDIETNTVIITGTYSIEDTLDLLNAMPASSIEFYKMARSAYPVSIADNFETGVSTEKSAQPSTMRIVFDYTIQAKKGRIQNLQRVYLAGIRNNDYFSERITP